MSTPNHTGKTRSARGMALMEMMGVLLLMGAFALIAGQLFNSLFRITTASREVSRRDLQRQELIDQLRADVWAAGRIIITEQHTLELQHPGERTVVWKISPEAGRLSRIERGAATEENQAAWTPLHPPIRFEALGPGVRIIWPPDDMPDRGAIELYSQRIILSGGRR